MIASLRCMGSPTSVAWTFARVYRRMARSRCYESLKRCKQLIDRVSGHQPDAKQQRNGAQDCRADQYWPPGTGFAR